uniref:Ymf72 n=1 Tax=Tetrahymena rostrata TaxID=5909 RepID=A0A650DE33_TETRO|nr:Ymf72 [Tetrahymena rostrata]QGS65274.1 Ymf72 [Tetrahymena rostrata]
MIIEKANKYKLLTSLIITPSIIYNPIGDNLPIGYGGWGVYIWVKLVILLLSYVLIYHYLYSIFWNVVEQSVYEVFDWFFDKIGGFKLDPSFNVIYLENIIIIVEYICYHYFLYFLFIM